MRQRSAPPPPRPGAAAERAFAERAFADPPPSRHGHGTRGLRCRRRSISGGVACAIAGGGRRRRVENQRQCARASSLIGVLGPGRVVGRWVSRASRGAAAPAGSGGARRRQRFRRTRIPTAIPIPIQQQAPVPAWGLHALFTSEMRRLPGTSRGLGVHRSRSCYVATGGVHESHADG